MYDLYKEKCLEENIEPVEPWSYRRIFNNRGPNLGFGNPKSDTCSKCDDVNAENVALHKKLAATAMQQMKDDRERAKTTPYLIYITFDLQKTLPLPKIPTSIAFYC